MHLHKLQISSGTFWFTEFATWNGYLYYKLSARLNRQAVLRIEREDDGDVYEINNETWLIL